MADERKTAACLAVGSELLGDRRLDSNSLTITRALARYGVTVEEKRVVGDSVERMAVAISDLLSRFDLVVVTGGLASARPPTTSPAMPSPALSTVRSSPTPRSRAGSAPGTPTSDATCPRYAPSWRESSPDHVRFATTAGRRQV